MAINSVGSATSVLSGKEFGISIDQQGQSNSKIGSPIIDNGKAQDNVNFADNLKNAMYKVDNLQKTANQKIEALATGQSANIHETMIAVEKAEISLKLMTKVRNKIIDAYQEVMKMQV